MSEQPYSLHHGDCIEVMKTLPSNSVDSIVTDPPYELGFMGKGWDKSGIAYNVEMWAECLRVLKPGGHLLAFSGSRTYHRMTCAIEDAGFDVRDQIMWIYGSGFPKSRNLDGDWLGWGTALKPAHEPICVARKPLIDTVAANVLVHGTGALNIDACRVPSDDVIVPFGSPSQAEGWRLNQRPTSWEPSNAGRWPANLIHDGSDEVLAEFPEAKGQQGDLVNHGFCRQSPSGVFGGMRPALDHPARNEGSKSAARFFYCAKASKADREEGLNDKADRILARSCQAQTEAKRGDVIDSGSEAFNKARIRKNNHPTVKPTELMRYLLRLVTPYGGTSLDPFTGSGSTGKAAMLEGFRFIGIEREAEYVEIAGARIQHAIDTRTAEEVAASIQPCLFDFSEAAA